MNGPVFLSGRNGLRRRKSLQTRLTCADAFEEKPEVVDGNMRALEMAYEVIERMTGMTKSA